MLHWLEQQYATKTVHRATVWPSAGEEGGQVAIVGVGWLLANALNIHQGWAMLMSAGAAMALGDS